MNAPASDEHVTAIQNYAYVLHLNGWTAEAVRMLHVLISNGCVLDEAKAREILAAFQQLDPLTQSLEPHKPLEVMRNAQIFSSLHLCETLSPYQKRVAFKSGVNFVNIETSSQCNRACPYCPNAKYDRRRDNAFLDMAAYEHVLDELAEIGYFRWIALVGLNEPLVHLEDFLVRLKMARAKLPNAKIRIYTNGDYLDKATFQALEDTGADDLNVSIHLGSDKTYNERDVLKRIFEKARELGVTPVLTDFAADKKVEFSMVGGRMHFVMRQLNYMTEGHSRGGVMTEVGARVENRAEPCIQPMDNFVVNYRGDVLPCCTTIGTSPEVEPCIVGNIHTESIFDIYCGKKMTGWRRHTVTHAPKAAPCATCSEKMHVFSGTWAQTVTQALEIADGIPPRPTVAADGTSETSDASAVAETRTTQ